MLYVKLRRTEGVYDEGKREKGVQGAQRMQGSLLHLLSSAGRHQEQEKGSMEVEAGVEGGSAVQRNEEV